MKDIVRKREDTYRFLAGMFREELKAEQIKEMIEIGVLNLLMDAGCNIDPEFFTNKSIQQIEEELAVEYASIFIGPGKHIAPYESMYVPDSTGRVGYYWGDSTIDMKAWVDHYGLKIAERYDSIPDHISIELEFMHRVVEIERKLWERDDIETAKKCLEIERTFLNKHINKWIPDFCDQVIDVADIDFYREIAKLTKGFILEESTLLNNKIFA